MRGMSSQQGITRQSTSSECCMGVCVVWLWFLVVVLVVGWSGLVAAGETLFFPVHKE